MSKAQRRKGNLQAASSAKAAELLQASGIQIPFIGVESGFLSLAGDGLDSADLAPEFRILFKKLGKRDALTREKAVKELAELMKSASCEQLRLSFQYFASIYQRCVTDVNNKIRAGINAVLGDYLLRLKKGAPNACLKQTLPFLLFSGSDASGQVQRSAETVQQTCFPAEKQQILTRQFAPEAIRLSLEILQRKHKLVQPQQFTDEESNAQRQARLVGQAFACINALIGDGTESPYFTAIVDTFTQPGSLNPLMTLGENVKSAIFTVASRLVSVHSAPFVQGKFPSLLLSHMDSGDAGVGRHVFECFLRLAQEPRFFEHCSLEKAVIPKIVSMIRKKGTHWNMLATYLLPCFSVLYTKLETVDAQLKFSCTILDSFFDGTLESISFNSWSSSFIEISKFCFVNFHTDSKCAQNGAVGAALFQRIRHFVDSVLDSPRSEEIGSLADFIGWVGAKLESKEGTACRCRQLLTELELHLLKALPRGEQLAAALLDRSASFCAAFNSQMSGSPPDQMSNQLLLKGLARMEPKEFGQIRGLADFLTTRIGQAEEQRGQECVQMLRVLCQVLLITNGLQSLGRRVDMNNFWVCIQLCRISLSEDAPMLDGATMFRLVKRLFCSFPLLELEFDANQMEPFLKQLLAHICAEFTSEQLDELLESALADENQTATDSRALAFALQLINAQNKIPTEQQHLIAGRYFASVLRCSEVGARNTHAPSILRQLECDPAQIHSQLHQFLNSGDATFDRIQLVSETCCGISRFKNASAEEVFLPTCEQVAQMVFQLDTLFSVELLSREELLLPYCLLRSRPSSGSSGRDAFDVLLRCAKHTLFYANVLSADLNGGEGGDSQRRLGLSSLLFVVATLLNAYKMRTPSQLQFKQLFPFSSQINCLFEKHQTSLDAFANFFLRFPNQFPFCALYAMVHLANGADIDVSRVHSPHIRQLFHTANLMRPKSGVDLDLILTHIPREEDSQIGRWVAEFEFRAASFSAANRAEHYVALVQFIEQHRSGVEDWLFAVQGEDLARDVFSCSMLRFCSQLVPHLAEVEGPIRDFINCALITALQNCTENLFDVTGTTSGGLQVQWLLAHFCCKLVARYETCMKLNATNHDYANISQEWDEFFGPSVANYMAHWFAKLAEPRSSSFPQFFVTSLCHAVHSLNSDRFLKAELPENFPANESKVDELEGYPRELRAILRPVLHLFFDSRPEVQYAASHLLKRALFRMFAVENASKSTPYVGTTSDGPSSSAGGGGEQQEMEDDTPAKEQEEERELGEEGGKRLPRFLNAVLSGELEALYAGRTLEICPKLLAWDVLISFLADLDVLSRVQFCDAIELRLLSACLAELFDALPDHPGDDLTACVRGVDELFTEQFQHQLFEHPFDREHFVCNLYFRTLVTIPSLVRDWFNTLGKAQAATVAQYTQSHVSPLVIRRELRSLENTRRGKLEIKVLPRVREVECSYRMEESVMRLSILLPENYPIGAPKVETGRSIVSKDLHRRWLLQLEVFLNRQNGDMLDGLFQWKRSIDQHLRGVEDCTICMSTVSTTNYQLPKIRCRQCKKKFHGDCLYKWFQTSSKSSCPLCRANFV